MRIQTQVAIMVSTTIAVVWAAGCAGVKKSEMTMSGGALIEAVKNGNITFVQRAIAAGADVNSIDTSGQSPLHHACYLGHLNIIKELINNGAKINNKAPELNLTPLHAATMNGDLKIVKYLVEHGADINAVDNEGATPLLSASWIGSLEVVMYLKSNGANIHVTTNYDATPLHYACQSGNIELVRFFINNGSDINFQAMNGSTPLHLATANGDLSVVRYLIENGAIIDFRMNYDATFTYCLKAPILTDNDVKHVTIYENQSPLDVAKDNGYDKIFLLLRNAEQQL